MKIKQISIFLENKPGHLNHACKVIADAGINLVTLSLSDTEQFGILRVIVKEWEKAQDVLLGAGFVVKVTDVIATEVNDEPGGLHEILDVIENSAINIEYMYAYTVKRDNRAVMVFRFDDADVATGILEKGNINVIGAGELFADQ